VALLVFTVLGTTCALWSNPLPWRGLLRLQQASLLVVGAELLLTYLEPVRIYVAPAAVAILAAAVVGRALFRGLDLRDGEGAAFTL
jgi:hypothetical protein